MANAIISANAPELNVVDGLPVVSSLALADHFEKPHNRVLDSIREISCDLPEELRLSDFRLSQYEGKTPTGGTRTYPMYLLTRDGFTLVAMGFTGKKALAWKVKYIQAFNEMERALLEGKHGEPVVLHSGDTLTPSEQSHLHAIVSAKAGMLPADMQRKVRSEIWTRFNRHFRIARYAQLPPAKMGEAVEYLVSMEVRAAQKALPQSNSEMAAASSLANYNQQIANTKPVHIFQRMGLTPLEELQMGSPIKRMFDGLDMDKIGPRTMEALVLKAKYVNAISEVYRLNRHLLKDMDRLMHDINGPAMKALNKSGCFSDPVADTLHEPRERLDRINEEYRAAARAALDGSICMAMMVGV